MEFLFFSDIKKLTGYADNRSVRAFLYELRIPVLRIGRRAAIDRTLFEARMEKRYRLSKQKNSYTPTLETEIAFLNELNNLLFKDHRVSSDIT